MVLTQNIVIICYYHYYLFLPTRCKCIQGNGYEINLNYRSKCIRLPLNVITNSFIDRLIHSYVKQKIKSILFWKYENLSTQRMNGILLIIDYIYLPKYYSILSIFKMYSKMCFYNINSRSGITQTKNIILTHNLKDAKGQCILYKM